MIEMRFRLKTLYEFKEAIQKTLSIYGLSECTREELEEKLRRIEKGIKEIAKTPVIL